MTSVSSLLSNSWTDTFMLLSWRIQDDGKKFTAKQMPNNKLEPGHLFHGYLIERHIHDGAYGQIYCALNSLGQRVALKIPVHDGFGNLKSYASFRIEYSLAGVLNHPNILEFRKGTGRFLEMEILEGEDLRTTITRMSPCSWSQTESILAQVCNALSYLHAKKIVHHDLKPENIMIDTSGAVKILDFGLSYCSDLDDPLETLEEPLGTPCYIAPEQLEGIRGEPASDMYSLGVIVYEMLTNELPFGKPKTASGARRRLYSDPTPPRLRRPDLPCGVQELLLLLLDRDPHARTTAQLLSDAIRNRIDWSSISCVTPERSAMDRWLDNFRIWKAPRYKAIIIDKKNRIIGRHILAVLHDPEVAERVINLAAIEATARKATVTFFLAIRQNLTEFDSQTLEETLLRKVDHALNKLSELGIKSRFRMKIGDPHKEILTYAQTRDVDLIIIAPRTLKGMKKIREGGGVTSRVVSNSTCDVLVVKSD